MLSSVSIIFTAPPYGPPVCTHDLPVPIEDEEVNLTCKSSGGLPAVDLRWLEEDEQLSDGPGTEGDKDNNDRGSRELVYTIGGITRDDTGTVFTCTAWNTAIEELSLNDDMTCSIQLDDILCKQLNT